MKVHRWDEKQHGTMAVSPGLALWTWLYLSLARNVAWRKVPNLPKPQFPHFENEGNYFTFMGHNED